ncbi:discoidin domain-containing protein [Desulfuromonas thiophila]|uniref:discoidin domain-containing protein n=1 Tax=Desulfuromonas thiophila TaxID=57664 RepID=UPI0029F5A23F|nr:discoidin domain-containing protein [Desulfuromonas thiophila]
MTLLSFRDDFLANADARLAQLDVAGASETDLLMAGALYKMAAAVGQADILGVSLAQAIRPLTGAQLDAWLSEPVNAALLRAALADPAHRLLLATDAAVVAALAASPAALALVTADASVLAALLALPLLRAGLLASAVGMEALLASATPLALLAADATWWADYTASTALTATAIPAMTGLTSPSGVAAASTYSSYNADKAMDKNSSTYWRSASGNTGNQWLKYTFPEPVHLHTVSLINYASSYGVEHFRVEYSDNDSTWQAAMADTTLPMDATPRDFPLMAPGRHRYWRLYILDGYSTTYVQCTEFDLKGWL